MLLWVRCGQLGHLSSKKSSDRSLVVVSSADCSIHFENLIVVCESCFSLVCRLLVISPGGLTVSLLLGHTSVLHLNLFRVCCFPLCILVLEHAAHSEDSIFLLGVCFFLFCLSLGGSHILSMLLVGPIALILSVKSHSVKVH